MELPKNITQIGESDRRCKIYAEDYVISYMKQLNLPAQDKDMAVALYGKRKEENEVSYIFLYGACKLDFLQRESRHLSQVQQQEVEKFRRKYFPEYEFMGYRLLNGEMVEGFHICENGTCRYVPGYAQFYEKNDSMLAYMLDTRQEEPAPEAFDQEKYNVVKQRQEERKGKTEEPAAAQSQKEQKPVNMKKFRFSAVTVFALLCVAGLGAMNGSAKVDELQVAARQMIDEMTQQKLPDAMEAVNATAQMDTIVAEDKLTDAIQKENEGMAEELTETPAEEQAQQPSAPDDAEKEETTETAISDTVKTPSEGEPLAEPAQSGELQTPPASETPKEPAEIPVSTPVAEPVGYVIQAGDTLIGISLRQYGSEKKVSEICSLNQINDPDDIKVGQKILLP